jgi:hypothetical protein
MRKKMRGIKDSKRWQMSVIFEGRGRWGKASYWSIITQNSCWLAVQHDLLKTTSPSGCQIYKCSGSANIKKLKKEKYGKHLAASTLIGRPMTIHLAGVSGNIINPRWPPN